MRQLHLLVSLLVVMSAQELLFLSQAVPNALQQAPQAPRTLQGTSVQHWPLETLNHWLITWAAK